MSLDTYSNIKTSVGTWLARDDLTSYIADLMTAAEYRIYREVRVRQMETPYSGTIASGVIALPSGFKGWKTLRIASSPSQVLQATDLDSLMRQYPSRSADGKPAVYAINGSNVEFGPYPDDTYSVAGTYWKQLTALSGANETNWLTSDAPELLLWASLSEAAPFLKDDARIAVWEGKYQAAKAALLAESRSEAGNGLSMRAA